MFLFKQNINSDSLNLLTFVTLKKVCDNETCEYLRKLISGVRNLKQNKVNNITYLFKNY